MKSLSKKFSSALTAFNSGEILNAKKICTRLSQKESEQTDVLHLRALIEKKLNNTIQAEYLFRKCLRKDQSKPEIYANFAGLLVNMGREHEAILAYKSAIKLNVKYSEAFLNLAILYNKRDEFEPALFYAESLLKFEPLHNKGLIVKATILQNLNQLSESKRALDEAENNGANASLIFQHRMSYLRKLNAVEPTHTTRNITLPKGLERNPDVLFQRSCVEYDLSESQKCEQTLKDILTVAPYHLQAHDALNKLLWEQGREEEFLQSYQLALKKKPSDQLMLAYVGKNIQSEQYDKAFNLISTLEGNHNIAPILLHFKGVIVSKQGQHEKAANYFRKALKLQPYSVRYMIDNASTCIRTAEFAKANVYLKKALEIDPLNQEAWAYQGLTWKLTANDRYGWLTNYAYFVREYELGIPDGYDNLSDFLCELNNVVARQHSTIRQPLDQSVIGGTQTSGNMLLINNKAIRDYKNMLNQNIAQYLRDLPKDLKHPFLSRNTNKFEHNGSWSVRLNRGGYHSNHVHPVGWLSNCTYLAVPKSISEKDNKKSGWLKFGETSLGLGKKDAIDKIICPKKGHHVLFPSYLWHGTIAFESDEYRTTLPSDIRPVNCL